MASEKTHTRQSLQTLKSNSSTVGIIAPLQPANSGFQPTHTGACAGKAGRGFEVLGKIIRPIYQLRAPLPSLRFRHITEVVRFTISLWNWPLHCKRDADSLGPDAVLCVCFYDWLNVGYATTCSRLHVPAKELFCFCCCFVSVFNHNT